MRLVVYRDAVNAVGTDLLWDFLYIETLWTQSVPICYEACWVQGLVNAFGTYLKWVFVDSGMVIMLSIAIWWEFSWIYRLNKRPGWSETVWTLTPGVDCWFCVLLSPKPNLYTDWVTVPCIDVFEREIIYCIFMLTWISRSKLWIRTRQ
jgi:hypothetical protein